MTAYPCGDAHRMDAPPARLSYYYYAVAHEFVYDGMLCTFYKCGCLEIRKASDEPTSP